MSTAIADLPEHGAPAESGVNYLNARYGIRSWLLTLDHKRIVLHLYKPVAAGAEAAAGEIGIGDSRPAIPGGIFGDPLPLAVEIGISLDDGGFDFAAIISLLSCRTKSKPPRRIKRCLSFRPNQRRFIT